MSWFSEVTGRDSYSQQSWRDSYNGGEAAGDWTGNHNARLDAERAAFQGHTWSGSSTQMSALEYAQSVGYRPSSGVVLTSGGGGGAVPVPSAPVAPAPGSAPTRRVASPASGGSRLSIAVPGVSPISGRPEIPGIKEVPLERIGGGNAQEALGAISDIGWVRTNSGGYAIVPSEQAKQRTEDDIFQQAQWMVRNVVMPGLGITPQPFPEFLNQDEYSFNFWSNEWTPKPAGQSVPTPNETPWWHKRYGE